jgi:hypothetical protein
MKLPNLPLIYRFLFIFALLAAIVVVHSCKKDNSSSKNQSTTDPSVNLAKQWYESTYPIFARSSNKLSTQSTGLTGVFDFSQHIKPDWAHAASYVRSTDKVVELPIDPSAAFGSSLSTGLTAGPSYPCKTPAALFFY